MCKKIDTSNKQHHKNNLKNNLPKSFLENFKLKSNKYIQKQNNIFIYQSNNCMWDFIP